MIQLKKENRGYTLIECIIACALIACIVLLSFSGMRFLHRGLIHNELQMLHATCIYLQQRALATGRPQKLYCDAQNHAYQYGQTIHNFPSSIRFELVSGIQGPPSKPVSMPTQPITFTGNTITFYPDGVLSSGTLYIHDTISHRLFALSISVAQVSLIRLYEYHDNAWQLIRGTF